MIQGPLRWAGGKSRLRKHILNIIPAHQRYVEPFAGAAWVLLGKPPSPQEVLNDADPEVVNFLSVLRHQHQQFLDAFRFELVSRAQFDHLAQLDPRTLPPVQRAHRFYYLVMAGWGGEYLHPRFQTAVRDAGHGNRLIGAMLHLEERIKPVHRRLQHVSIENLDWRACLQRHDGPDTLFYLDPPYPGNGVNYAHNMRQPAQHDELAQALSKTQAHWLLSSYNNQDTRHRYAGCWIIQIHSQSGMPGTTRPRSTNHEVVITSFDPNQPLGDRPTPHLQQDDIQLHQS